MLVNLKDKKHRGWFAIFLLGTVLTVGWYAFYSLGKDRWPGGGSPPGLTFGVAAGAIMVFEFLLWPKKKFRRIRTGKAQIWLRAHIWLGLLLIPLVSFHAGIDWGGELTWLLMVLFWIVILSGVLGLILQNMLPKLLLSDVRFETVFSQIEHVAETYAVEAENFVTACCGGPAEAWETLNDDGGGVGVAVKRVGARRTLIPTEVPIVEIENESQANYLRRSFDKSIKPYLEHGAQAPKLKGDRDWVDLRVPGNAAPYFQGIRGNLPEEVGPVVDQLETWAKTRRQFDRQAKIHAWLHGWLSVHLPVSVALILLLFVHIFFALKYR